MADKDENTEASTEILSSTQDGNLVIATSASLNVTTLSNNIITQLSDMPDSIITSLSTNGNIMTSQGPIIITNEGIVFPPGSLIMRHEDNDNLDESSPLEESLNDDSANDNNEFDIKVESNALKQNQITSFKVENNPADSANSNFTINQNVLQNIQDSEPDLQHMPFSNSEHVTQFHIQMPLSMSDVQNLHKINRNVFMSQAALPEDVKVLDSENIIIERDTKHNFLTTTGNADNKAMISNDDAKQYLTSDANFSTDESGNIYIKHEASINTENVDSSSVKSETILATANQSATSAYQPIVYVQVGSDNRAQLLPIASSNGIADHASSVLESSKPNTKHEQKKKRKAKNPRAPPKLVNVLPKEVKNAEKTPALRTLAPRLLSYPLYAGAQAGIGVGKTLLRPYNIATMQYIEGGQYFEVLGRCTQCFRFSRTTSYCRAEKNHRDPKSSVCMECEYAGLSTVVCRRKLNHSAPNAQPLNIVINTALQNPDHVKQLCSRNYLPACFGELHSIVIHHADITFVAQRHKVDDQNSEMLPTVPLTRKPTDYARGYLYPYSKEKWDIWLTKFCHQTGTNYRIRTGKRVNKKTDHGLANHNGKITSYRTLETQLYNCALGGKPRKRKLKDGIRKRKERGSKLIGCPAVIHTRLLETEYEWCALEITVPKVLAHLSCHDPRGNINNDVIDYDDLLLSQINPTQIQQPNQDVSNQQQQRFDFVQVVGEESAETKKKNESPSEIKRNTRNILVTCASLLDTIDNTEVLSSLQESAQDILNKLIKEAATVANKQPAPKPAKRRKGDVEIEEENVNEIEIEQVASSTYDQMNINLLTNVT